MTAPETRLNPRKTPRQSRSQATCAAIVEAAARILETQGSQGLTTNHVAQLAGVSVGSLYQYFPGKEAIMVELIRRMRQDMLADFEAAALETRGRGLEFAVDRLVSASLLHHMRRPALAQVLEREEPGLQLDAEIHALKARMREIVVETLRDHAIDDAERTAFDISAVARGLAEAAIQAGQRDFDDLRGRICRAINGYLGSPPAAATGGRRED